MRLHVLAFALAAGIMWALHFVLVTAYHMAFGRAGAWVQVLVDLYPGYSPTFPGMLIGAGLGFVDAVAFCAIVAWLYNRIAARLEASRRVSE